MDLLILGASARAAAFSALRAGFPHPTAIDLFADRDLTAACPATRVSHDSYPEALIGLAEQAPFGPWLYTGALENHPDIVDRIAARRPLWGNDGNVLRRVRDPFAVADVLRHAGLPCPEVRPDSEGLPRDGSWLVKPTASAGGQGIRPLGSDPLEASRRCYYQERIAGPSVSALFLGLRDRAELLGVTRQWVGRPGAEFAYVGSVAPWPISRPILSRLEAIGEVLTRAFALTGLFGIDAILSDGVPWPVEVNPRYTAAVEVLELALGRSLLAEHRRAYDPGAPATNNSGGPSARAVLDRLAHGKRGQAPGLRNSLRDSTAHGAGSQSPFSSAVRNAKDNRSSRFVAKRIVFASTSCRFPDSYAWEPLGRDRFAFAVPTIADVPHPGTPFEPGDPVLTLFATGTSLEACQRQLQRRQTWWERRLRGTEDSRFEIPDSR